MIAGLGKTAGIKVTVHSFRRGFACNLVRKGMNSKLIMTLGGWSNLDMVETYTQAVGFEDAEAVYEEAMK